MDTSQAPTVPGSNLFIWRGQGGDFSPLSRLVAPPPNLATASKLGDTETRDTFLTFDIGGRKTLQFKHRTFAFNDFEGAIISIIYLETAWCLFVLTQSSQTTSAQLNFLSFSLKVLV